MKAAINRLQHTIYFGPFFYTVDISIGTCQIRVKMPELKRCCWESFIKLLCPRTAIWSISSKEYMDRNLTAKNWQDTTMNCMKLSHLRTKSSVSLTSRINGELSVVHSGKTKPKWCRWPKSQAWLQVTSKKWSGFALNSCASESLALPS